MPSFLQYEQPCAQAFSEQTFSSTSKTVAPSLTVTVVAFNIIPFEGKKDFFSERSLSRLLRIVLHSISMVQVTVFMWVDVTEFSVVNVGVSFFGLVVLFFRVVLLWVAEELFCVIPTVCDVLTEVVGACFFEVASAVVNAGTVVVSEVLSTLVTVKPQPERRIRAEIRISEI